MTIEKLVPELSLESKTVEYKGIIKEGKSDSGKNLEIGWLKTIVAFANTEGGKLIIGVENDTHKVVSLDKKTADKIILMIHRQIKERVDPEITYDITPVPVQNADDTRYILEVSVNKNSNLPVTLHEDGLLGIYIRKFGRTDIATSEQIKELILMSDNTPFDTYVTNVKYNRLAFSRLFDIASERGIKITDKELISKGAVTDTGLLTRGMTLFSDDCTDLRTKVVATVWPELTKGGNIVNATEEYVGDLLAVIEKSIMFIKAHSANGFRKVDTQNVPYIAYPARAITEGVVNAVGHRNYYMFGTQIEINIFKDRLEITSPGALLGVKELYKEKNIASIIPRRRNEVICSILEMCKYMEKKGSGFDNIEEDYSVYDEKYAPFITSDSSSFTLTLPDLTYKSGLVDQDAESPDVYVEEILEGKKDLKILSFCYNKKRSVKEIADKVGVTPSTYFRSKVIDRLVSTGFLVEIKETTGAMYLANKENVKLK